MTLFTLPIRSFCLFCVCNFFLVVVRYKREEVKIQAWQNHQMKKAEMDNRKVEVLIDV